MLDGSDIVWLTYWHQIDMIMIYSRIWLRLILIFIKTAWFFEISVKVNIIFILRRNVLIKRIWDSSMFFALLMNLLLWFRLVFILFFKMNLIISFIWIYRDLTGKIKLICYWKLVFRQKSCVFRTKLRRIFLMFLILT